MKQKGMIIAVIVILIVIGIVVGVFMLGHTIGTDLEQEQLLKEEIETLSSFDPTTDDYNTPIKTTGVYGEIETTIKEYLSSYANSTQKASALMTQMQEENVLTNENYKEDGPEFTNSLAKIDTQRTEFNQEMDNLISLRTVEAINQKGEEKNWDSYYLDLYKACLLDTDIESELKESKAQLEQAKQAVNDALDQQEKILTYLRDHKENWRVSDEGRLEFDDQTVLDGYSALAVQPENEGE